VGTSLGNLLDPHTRFGLVGALTRPYWRRRFASFGDGSLIYKPEWVYRPDLIAIGERVWINPRVWLEVGGAGLHSSEPVLRISDGVVLRHHVTISAHESVVIEEDVLIAAWTSIYDSDHTLGRRGNAIWHPDVTAPVRVGRGTWLGERVAVLRGADIGTHCIIGANSVVKGTIPDYSVAAGAPAKVVGSTREMVDRAGG
jgi:acetyltransferase-like isoleucine patch superfamily enzyme